jgi:hypothetical protein
MGSSSSIIVVVVIVIVVIVVGYVTDFVAYMFNIYNYAK